MHEQIKTILSESKVDGNIVRLPEGQLARPVYEEVAKAIKLIGGKWKGGKTMGFVFESDPTELLQKIAQGDKINLKKEFQFFATPQDLAAEMVHEANIQEGETVAELQAGDGAIVNEILRRLRLLGGSGKVYISELMELNRMKLRKLYTGIDQVVFLEDVSEDFIDALNIKGMLFDKIVANPPFNKNQDIDHIRKMYDLLTPGGRLVTLSSKHWQYSSFNKEKAFEDWLYNEVDATVNSVAAGRFKESGTLIETLMITIDKPKL